MAPPAGTINVPQLCGVIKTILSVVDAEGHARFRGMVFDLGGGSAAASALLAGSPSSVENMERGAQESVTDFVARDKLLYLEPVVGPLTVRSKNVVERAYSNALEMYLLNLPERQQRDATHLRAACEERQRREAAGQRASAQETRMQELERTIRQRELDAADREREQQNRIKQLQKKIRQVEVQAAVRQVQARLLEIKIRQVELMVLVRQAQQVMDLRGRETSLLQKKRELEAKIMELEGQIKHHGDPGAGPSGAGGPGSAPA